MNQRHLMVLAVIATLAVIAALWSGTTGNDDPQGAVGQIVLPGLDEALNDVSAVRLDAGPDATLTLERGPDAWVVREKGGYPVDAAKIRTFLIDLANATVIEEKTANPDNYARLGLADPGDDDGGVRIELSVPDHEAYVLIAGNASRGGEAAYVRLPDEMQSWLVSGKLEAETDALGWLDTAIVDIPATRIQSVTVRHADGESLEISKDARDASNFNVAAVPAGRRLQYESAANPLGAALSALRLEDVRAFDDEAFSAAEAVETAYRTFDGLVLTVRGYKDDAGGHLHLRAAFDEAQAMRFVEPAASASDAGEPGTSDTENAPAGAAETVAQDEPASAETAIQGSAGEPDFGPVREEAGSLDARLSPWIFQVSSYKFDQMSRRMEGITVAEDEE